mgnify:CR=1 FL=1
MKRYITVLALSALVCSSCSDFLDVQPEGNATTTSNRPLMPLTDYMKDSIKRVVTAVNYSGNREPHATLFGDVHAVITLWRP